MRMTVPIMFWELGLYPKDQWEFVGYEFAGGGPIPTSVEIRKKEKNENNNINRVNDFVN